MLYHIVILCHNLSCFAIICTLLRVFATMFVTNLSLGCNSQLNWQIEHLLYFFVTSTYNWPNKVWSKKLYHPTIGERQKRWSSLLPRASSYAEALLLLSIFTYSKSILFIALSSSSTMNLYSIFGSSKTFFKLELSNSNLVYPFYLLVGTV